MNNYFSDLTYKKTSEERVFDGVRVKVDRAKYLVNGQEIVREIVKAGNAVVILPIKENGNVIMIQEERQAIDKKILGLPAGMIEEGEDPKEAALRELEEETGYRANNIQFTRSLFTSCGYSNEKIYYYLATDFTKTKQHLDEGEFIDVVEVPLDKLKEMLYNNELITGSVTIALMDYFLRFEDKDKNKE